MSKRCILVYVLLAGFSAGCKGGDASNHLSSQAEQVLQGEHALRKMRERVETNGRLQGGFFLFTGSIQGEVNTSVSVKFAWKMNDGSFALSSLPLEKIRVRIDEKATSPTIKFRWRPYNMNRTAQIQDLMNNHVLYALVTVQESDWPAQVVLPLNAP